jgi:DNA-binding NarL/FixJ family response regulator
MITVGIIEDDRSLRRNLEAFVELEKDLLITFSCNSMEDFLEKRAKLDEPFVVFLDLGLPGISGLEGITFIREKWADVHLVVITGNDGDAVIFDCIQRGANGYLLKPFRIDELRKNIDIIRSGGALITPDVAMKLFRKIHKPQERYEDHLVNLTTRETSVVNELLKGLTYKEIAIALGISATTVNDHLKNVYFKMGVHTKSELIAKVLRK